MSKSNRRPSANSRASSSSDYRALSVTEAVQSIRLTETAGEHPVVQRRSSQRDLPPHEHSPSERRSHPLSTLDPSMLDSYPISARSSFPGFSASTPSSHLGVSATMSSYPSYTQPLGSSYRGTLPQRSSSNYGYIDPSAGASMSRSMSGPYLPSMPPNTYEQIQSVGREFVERRRHPPHNRPRRERKILLRQAALPPRTLRPFQSQEVSDSINSFIAHSSSSFESTPSYSTSSSHATYSGATARSPYEPSPYHTAFSSGAMSENFPSTSRNYGGGTTGYDYPNAPPRHPKPPVVIEEREKPQCWDHGCNGRQFSTFSNLLRHQREKSGNSNKSVCPKCGALFTRKTARDGHIAQDKCKQKTPER